MKKILAITACLLTTGCVEYQTAKPVDVRFNSAAQSNVRGYHSMAVRAFVGKASQKTELTGVPCDVIGSGYNATVYTPAAVNVPMYGSRSKAVYVQCSYDGEQQDTSMRAINLTESQALASGAGAGVLGVIVTTAVVAARKNKDQDEYGYNPVRLVFKKGQTSN